MTYRAENHWKIGPTGLKNTLAKLEGMGADRATAALRYSMAQGWQGIFEEQGGRGGTRDDPRGNLAVVDQYIKEHCREK